MYQFIIAYQSWVSVLTDWPGDKTGSFYSPCLCSHTLTMTFGKDRCGLIASQIIQTKNSTLYPKLLNLPVCKNKFNYFKKKKSVYISEILKRTENKFVPWNLMFFIFSKTFKQYIIIIIDSMCHHGTELHRRNGIRAQSFESGLQTTHVQGFLLMFAYQHLV